jgi:hypothetical protein
VDNKEQLKQKCKEYYETNKEKISEQKKEYRINNRETNKEQCKKYYETNKEQILEKDKIKITCECGSIVRKSDLSTHKKSKKHKDFIISQQLNS